jgi:hypothetical protein
VSTRRAPIVPPAPVADDDAPLPVHVVPPANADEEGDAWERLAAALAWLQRQGPMDA